MTRRDATHSRPQPLTPRLASAHPAPSVCLELDSCGHCLPSHTPWSQPRTALPHPTPAPMWVTLSPSPRPSAAQMPPAGELGCPQAQEAPSPSTLRLCHLLSAWTEAPEAAGQAHGHAGQHTSACLALSAPEPPLGGTPITALLATLQGPWPWPPCHVGRAGCLPLPLPPPCWDLPSPASPSSAQPPASCPLLDCSVALGARHPALPFLIWGA